MVWVGLGWFSPRSNNIVPLKLKRTAIVKELLPKLDELDRSRLLSRFKVEYTDFKGQDDGGLTADLFTEFFIRICEPGSAASSGAVLSTLSSTPTAALEKPNTKDGGGGSGSGSGSGAAAKDGAAGSGGSGGSSAASAGSSSGSGSGPGLFVGVALEDAPKSGVTYLPNPEITGPNSTNHYRGIGKLLCKSLIDGRPLPTRFAPSLFKFLLNLKPNLKDLESYDRTTANSFKKILVCCC